MKTWIEETDFVAPVREAQSQLRIANMRLNNWLNDYEYPFTETEMADAIRLKTQISFMLNCLSREEIFVTQQETRGVGARVEDDD